MTQPVDRPSRPRLLLYGALALPLSFAGLPLYLHAPDFYATELNRSIALLGGTLLVLRAIDALQDPLIGALSDRYARHRNHILLSGGLMLLAGFAGLFNPAMSPLPDGGLILWFAVCVFLCTTGFSVVTINYQALGGLWDVPSEDRTRVTGAREAFGLVGILAASILPAVLQAGFGAERAFSILTLILAPVFVAGGLLFYRWRRSVDIAPGERRDGMRLSATGLIRFLGDPWAGRFYGVFFVSNFASAIPAVLVLFFVRDRLAAEEYTGLFLVVYFISGAASLPVWQAVAARIGKARAWAFSMVLATATFMWAFTLGAGDVVPFAIICVLSGSALGADLAVPPAMVADRLEDMDDRHRAARYFSANAFFAKTAFALATGLSLPLLAFLGYEPGRPAEGDVGLSLAVVYALVPCLIKVASAVWLFRALPVLRRD